MPSWSIGIVTYPLLFSTCRYSCTPKMSTRSLTGLPLCPRCVQLADEAKRLKVLSLRTACKLPQQTPRWSEWTRLYRTWTKTVWMSSTVLQRGDKWKTTVREPPADIARCLQHECQRLVAGDPFWRNVNRPPRENGEEQFFKRQEGNGQSVETLLSHQ